MNRRERRAAQSSNKTSVTALGELARQHMQAGRPLDAQLCCQQALALDPDHAETLHLMGLLFLQARQYDHAIAWIDRASRQDRETDYLGSLGIALDQPPRLEPVAERGEVIDLAVEDGPDGAVLIRERLVPAREVDNREPAEAQRRMCIAVNARVVGPAVLDGRTHPLDPDTL